MTHKENIELNNQLEQSLIQRGLRYIKGFGTPQDDSWEPEESFLILEINRGELIFLAKMFHQNAVVYGGKLFQHK